MSSIRKRILAQAKRRREAETKEKKQAKAPVGKMPAKVKKFTPRAVPTKVGVVLDVKNLKGQVVFQGTEDQWRRWVKERPSGPTRPDMRL